MFVAETETEIVLDFRHSCVIGLSLKMYERLLLPCQPSILKNDQSKIFFSNKYFFRSMEFSPLTHCNVFWQQRECVIGGRLLKPDFVDF